ncbi:hypothetical protein K432DRAFT_126932 [Lepidopterella palustris CBS 459.81]|uniref:Uncharacterized protein n=1 Tax=Lepidopterella palustris CBS 459.81 TaxID=1314670 RepID=A0A8E2E4P0_9PEZI|nr:hypothetical protein K432DRAFT_126932 [Lepidopterella palustris CBS 459.81]
MDIFQRRSDSYTVLFSNHGSPRPHMPRHLTLLELDKNRSVDVGLLHPREQMHTVWLVCLVGKSAWLQVHAIHRVRNSPASSVPNTESLSIYGVLQSEGRLLMAWPREEVRDLTRQWEVSHKFVLWRKLSGMLACALVPLLLYHLLRVFKIGCVSPLDHIQWACYGLS